MSHPHSWRAGSSGPTRLSPREWRERNVPASAGTGQPLAGLDAVEANSLIQVCCVVRREGGRVFKIGVEVAGNVLHLHPAGLMFAMKMGAWRVWAPTPAGPRELGIGVDDLGREFLRMAGAPAGEDSLATSPPCDHPRAAAP